MNSRGAGSGSAMSAALHDDRLDRVRDVGALVGGALEPAVDLLPAEHVEHVVATAEQIGGGVARDRVGLVLEPVDLDRERNQVLQVLQVVHRAFDLLATLGEDLGEPMASAASSTSSRLLARRWMSSRSSGVMNVRLSRSKISWVTRSASCSTSLSSRARSSSRSNDPMSS